MARKIHRIHLTEEERRELEGVVKKGRCAALKRNRAQALLLCDERRAGGAWRDQPVAEAVGLSVRSIEQLRQYACEVGPLVAIERVVRKTPPIEPKITGEVEAQITKIACSAPPEGHTRWTLQMISDRLVELEVIDSISRESVRQVLKKTH